MGSASESSEPYLHADEIAGAIDPAQDNVLLRRVLDGPARQRLHLLLFVNSVCVVALVATWVAIIVAAPTPATVEAAIALTALMAIACTDVMRLVQTLGLGVFAHAMRDPVPMAPPTGVRIAALTTIVPSSEPIELIDSTLRAMTQLDHDGTLDVWVLDEGDSPVVRELAARLGVNHFSRAHRPEYNTEAGTFRAATKAGNHNAWRVEHGDRYDFVAQVDPDHTPLPSFLTRTLGYFRDRDVAFVVAPQVYGNAHENWVARAAAAQGYVFAAVVQRGGNSFETPLLIGTNHVYRVEAWQTIDGYQDSLIEDHLTGMVVQGTVNPCTGQQWRGVYTPDILAVGEGPVAWADYFRQQQRWSAGVWEIIKSRRSRATLRLTRGQRWAYAFLQSFYPTVGLSWLVGLAATVIFACGLVNPTTAPAGWAIALAWSAALASWVALFTWLRAWNLSPHERTEGVLRSWCMTLFAAPIYAWSAICMLSGRRGHYHVTGKGALRRRDTPGVFVIHLSCATAIVAAVGIGWIAGAPFSAATVWAILCLAACLAPPSMSLVSALRTGTLPWRCHDSRRRSLRRRISSR